MREEGGEARRTQRRALPIRGSMRRLRLLIELKERCPHKGPGNFSARAEVELPEMHNTTRSCYMRLAAHRPLLLQHVRDETHSNQDVRG